ncbi:ABC transporter ATP-binding protein, partial [Candidatus Atribacteria bacterium HGW-Atribacteria-1]
GGEIYFEGKDLLKLDNKEIRKIRGKKISMIFQEPMTSLDPVFTIGHEIGEAIQLHQGLNKKEARKKAIEILKIVGIPDVEKRIDNYPHELSGGMRQRVMIAMALSCNPTLLIADEPTTALDVTIQAQILRLINDLKDKFGASVMLITHDLGVIAEMCDNVAVMYAGHIVEYTDVYTLFSNPLHPYTKGLSKSIPRMNVETEHLDAIPGIVPNLLDLPSGCPFHVEVKNLKKWFWMGKSPLGKKEAVRAVDDVSFYVKKKEVLGLVGESGCGKTTCGKVILRILDPTDGSIYFNGQEITHLNRKEILKFRKRMMIIYQDPFGSLDPRMTIGATIAEPMEVHKIASKKEQEEKVIEIMGKVGLLPDQINRYPHEFSGGQRQRIGIARALATNPEFIVADECVSALDVSIQAQIIN